MKNIKERGEVLREGLGGESKQFGVKKSSKLFDIISDSLYTRPIEAIIRELSTNAVDAQKRNGNEDKEFEVRLPNKFDNEFYVRDYGPGLSEEDVMNLYTTVFESDKDDTNRETGNFGVGSKSPLSYVDQFSVESYRDGVKHLYTVFRDDEGRPRIKKVGEVNTPNEPNGLCVRFRVPKHKRSDKGETINDWVLFQYYAIRSLRWFDVHPNIEGGLIEIDLDETFEVEAGDIEEKGWAIISNHLRNIRKYVQQNRDWDDSYYGVDTSSKQFYYADNAAEAEEVGVVALSGNNAYKIDQTQVNFDLPVDNVVLSFGIGEVYPAVSREELQYNQTTEKSIREKVKQVKDSLREEYVEKIEDIKNADTYYQYLIEGVGVLKGFSKTRQTTELFKKLYPQSRLVEVNTGFNTRMYTNPLTKQIGDFPIPEHKASGRYWMDVFKEYTNTEGFDSYIPSGHFNHYNKEDYFAQGTKGWDFIEDNFEGSDAESYIEDNKVYHVSNPLEYVNGVNSGDGYYQYPNSKRLSGGSGTLYSTDTTPSYKSDEYEPSAVFGRIFSKYLDNIKRLINPNSNSSKIGVNEDSKYHLHVFNQNAIYGRYAKVRQEMTKFYEDNEGVSREQVDSLVFGINGSDSDIEKHNAFVETYVDFLREFLDDLDIEYELHVHDLSDVKLDKTSNGNKKGTSREKKIKLKKYNYQRKYRNLTDHWESGVDVDVNDESKTYYYVFLGHNKVTFEKDAGRDNNYYPHVIKTMFDPICKFFNRKNYEKIRPDIYGVKPSASFNPEEKDNWVCAIDYAKELYDELYGQANELKVHPQTMSETKQSLNAIIKRFSRGESNTLLENNPNMAKLYYTDSQDKVDELFSGMTEEVGDGKNHLIKDYFYGLAIMSEFVEPSDLDDIQDEQLIEYMEYFNEMFPSKRLYNSDMNRATFNKNHARHNSAVLMTDKDLYDVNIPHNSFMFDEYCDRATIVREMFNNAFHRRVDKRPNDDGGNRKALSDLFNEYFDAENDDYLNDTGCHKLVSKLANVCNILQSYKVDYSNRKSCIDEYEHRKEVGLYHLAYKKPDTASTYSKKEREQIKENILCKIEFDNNHTEDVCKDLFELFSKYQEVFDWLQESFDEAQKKYAMSYFNKEAYENRDEVEEHMGRIAGNSNDIVGAINQAFEAVLEEGQE